jgi:murein L,D-transpeptidase YcbB/YkuD
MDKQRNKIAVFDDFVHGAAAQFDLWASNYTGMTLQAAINKWSGGNSPTAYANFLEQRTGAKISVPVTKAFLASDAGWKLLKAQSRWEAGQEIPMTDAEWQQAQQLVFGAGEHDDPSIPIQSTVIRLGARGEVVKKMQTALGFTGKDADGVFGHDSQVALKAAQFTHGLTNDGVCGPASWAMLKVTGA